VSYLLFPSFLVPYRIVEIGQMSRLKGSKALGIHKDRIV
jgi:hypothetical protein